MTLAVPCIFHAVVDVTVAGDNVLTNYTAVWRSHTLPAMVPYYSWLPVRKVPVVH
jgi:hypothetical protein